MVKSRPSCSTTTAEVKLVKPLLLTLKIQQAGKKKNPGINSLKGGNQADGNQAESNERHGQTEGKESSRGWETATRNGPRSLIVQHAMDHGIFPVRGAQQTGSAVSWMSRHLCRVVRRSSFKVGNR